MPRVGTKSKSKRKQKGNLNIQVTEGKCDVKGCKSGMKRGVKIDKFVFLCSSCHAEVMLKVYDQTKGENRKSYGLRTK